MWFHLTLQLPVTVITRVRRSPQGRGHACQGSWRASRPLHWVQPQVRAIPFHTDHPANLPLALPLVLSPTPTTRLTAKALKAAPLWFTDLPLWSTSMVLTTPALAPCLCTSTIMPSTTGLWYLPAFPSYSMMFSMLNPILREMPNTFNWEFRPFLLFPSPTLFHTPDSTRHVTWCSCRIFRTPSTMSTSPPRFSSTVLWLNSVCLFWSFDPGFHSELFSPRRSLRLPYRTVPRSPQLSPRPLLVRPYQGAYCPGYYCFPVSPAPLLLIRTPCRCISPCRRSH